MPDTHLAMPRTLSAPYADLLEAEAPRTMTTSEATNGTSAAAAAFARLLASGDQAMQPETSAITDSPPSKAPACNAAHRPQELRAMLLGSTTIPALGMTLAEASQKTADLLEEVNAFGSLSDERVNAIHAELDRLERVIAATEPRTILDAACILDRVFPIDARANLDRDIPALRRVATFLHQVVEAARSASPDETSIIPSIGLTFRQAADRVRELLKRGSTELKDDPEDAAELERVEAERFSDAGEWSRIERAMLATPAQTVGDLLAKIERLACPELGIRHLVFPDEDIAQLEDDVQRLQPLWSEIGPSTVGDGHPDADILALGRRRAELIDSLECPGKIAEDDAEPVVIEWKEIDHLIMELEPRTAAGLAVQLSAIWSLFPEPDEKNGPTADGRLERAWLWTAMKNAERIGGSAQLAHDRQDADVPIFAAYSRWSELVQDCYAAKTDDDCERLSEQADEAAFDVMTHEPATREGLAAQVFVMLHLEHGGTTADHLDIGFSALTGGDGPDSAAVQALVDRVKRVGRRDEAYELYAAAMEERIGTAASNDLRQAWEELRALDAAEDQSATADPDFDIYRQQREAITARILSAPICTAMDREILVRFALHSAVAHWGDEPTISTQGAEHIIALRRLLGAPAVANDQRHDADAFADTVAAFEAEAPATLALPLEPTGRMVDAGASAAGITPAQFQAAYAAAVEALKLERAA